MSRRHFLAAAVLAAITGAACSESEPDVDMIEGIWGGEGIQLVVEGAVTQVHLSCADGQVEGLIHLDQSGQFKRVGTIAIGPVVREFEPASFEGHVSGDALVLRIEVLESGVLLGPFTAVRGRDVQLVQCR